MHAYIYTIALDIIITYLFQLQLIPAMPCLITISLSSELMTDLASDDITIPAKLSPICSCFTSFIRANLLPLSLY